MTHGVFRRGIGVRKLMNCLLLVLLVSTRLSLLGDDPECLQVYTKGRGSSCSNVRDPALTGTSRHDIAYSQRRIDADLISGRCLGLAPPLAGAGAGTQDRSDAHPQAAFV